MDVNDCRPAVVYQQPEERTWYLASSALLTAADFGFPGDATFDEHHTPIYDSTQAGCDPFNNPVPNPECLVDPIEDPCGLWRWVKVQDGDIERWSLTATQGYEISTFRYQDFVEANPPEVPENLFGWEDCREACLGDPQCVGASMTERTETAFDCRLIAKSQYPDITGTEYIHPPLGLPSFDVPIGVRFGNELPDRHKGQRRERLPGAHDALTR